MKAYTLEEKIKSLWYKVGVLYSVEQNPTIKAELKSLADEVTDYINNNRLSPRIKKKRIDLTMWLYHKHRVLNEILSSKIPHFYFSISEIIGQIEKRKT